MPVIQGFVRFRKHQLGKQTAFGSNAAATRVLPLRGVPKVNPNWTDPDLDTGTLDPVVSPYRTGIEITCTTAGDLDYDTLPALLSAAIKGGVTPTGAGAAKTWTHQAASETADDWEYFTDEWGDDTNASDGFVFRSGIVESLDLSFDDKLGPWKVSADWRFAKLDTYPTARTGGLNVDTSPHYVYGADSELYINDTSGAIGTTKIADALISARISVENEVDVKRFANGSNTRFEVAGYGRAGRKITAEFTFEKTTAVFAEVTNWLASAAVDRFVELRATSPDIIAASAPAAPYAASIRLPLRWRMREDGDSGGNATITLTGEGYYDASGLGYPFRSVVVNARATL